MATKRATRTPSLPDWNRLSPQVREAFGWAVAVAPSPFRDLRDELARVRERPPELVASSARSAVDGSSVPAAREDPGLSITALLVGILHVRDERGVDTDLIDLVRFLGITPAQARYELQNWQGGPDLEVWTSASQPLELDEYPRIDRDVAKLLLDVAKTVSSPTEPLTTRRLLGGIFVLRRPEIEGALNFGSKFATEFASVYPDFATGTPDARLAWYLDVHLGRYRRTPVRPVAQSDQPTEDDTLGFGALVDGLGDLLDATGTTLPLTLGLTAPWGGGKSSVMLQLKKWLRRPSNQRRWTVIEFPAWRYETTGQMWPALARAIYVQAIEQMSGWRERWMFRFRLERGRLPRTTQIIRLIGPAGAGLVGLVVGSDVAGTSTGVAAGLTAIVASAGQLWGSVSDPFKNMIDQYLAAPRPEMAATFDSDAQRSIDQLMELLTKHDDRALAVFVDDLDRCSPRNVVGTIEAVNQMFNARPDGRCVFLLAMDREIVATSIEASYLPLITRLEAQGSSLADDFGLQFLAKVVQLTIALPKPTPIDLTRLISRAELPPLETEHRAAAERPSVGQIKVYRDELEKSSQQNPGDFYRAKAEIERRTTFASDRSALEEAARQIQTAVISGDAPDVLDAEIEALKLLERNPRQVKRFDNAFRLQLHVLNRTRTADFAFDLASLRAVARWVAIRLRWPGLAEDIEDEPRLLQALEEAAEPAQTSAGLTLFSPLHDALEKRWPGWFQNEALLASLREEPKLSMLPEEAFLRVS